MEDEDDSSFQDNRVPVNDDEKHYLLASTPPPVSVKTEKPFGSKLKRFLVFSSLWVAYLIISAAYSMISPFYPQEVRR